MFTLIFVLSFLFIAFFLAGVVVTEWRRRRRLYRLDPPEVSEAAFGRGRVQLLRREKPNMGPNMSNPVKELSGTPVSETADGKRWAVIARSHCPHCDHDTRFIEGPSGGMMTNIQCEICGYWFNVAPLLGIAHEIGFKDRQVRQ